MTLSLIYIASLIVFVAVFNKKLKQARYETNYNKEMLAVEKANYEILEQAFTNQSTFVNGLLADDKRKSAKILSKNQEIEKLKNQVK